MLFRFLNRKSSSIQIKRKHEAHHFLVCGATGTGKTTALRDMMYYAKSRRDVCVIHDPKREFLAEFYEQDRGDWIMDPTDDRCPYWNISEEVTDLADAISTMRGVYPSHPNNPQAQFWDDSACEISAHLVTEHKPTCEQFGLWLRDPAEIDKRIKGTEHAQTLTKNSPNLRSGILATLNNAGRPMRMMPTLREERPQIILRKWVAQRKGWIFLPNKQDTRESLRPLQSMWLDMLMLRTMSLGKQPSLPRIWFFLDELAALNTLPQLHSALSEMRFTECPIVLGIQNIASLQDLYGRLSETICSQAMTQLILGTTGKAPAEFEKEIGEQEILRLEESYSYDGGRTRKTFSIKEIRRPAVLASDISGLPDLEGYLVQRGNIVRFKMAYTQQIFHNNPHIPREIPRLEPLTPAKATDETDATASETNELEEEEQSLESMQQDLQALAHEAGVPLPLIFQTQLPIPQGAEEEMAAKAFVQKKIDSIQDGFHALAQGTEPADPLGFSQREK